MTAPASPPADPFTSLAVHYGMLLGVADFQVLGANPRGRLRLHQSWQHGAGVVWGYPVTIDADRAQIVVGPGLAIDGLGREVVSNAPCCLDVRAWLDDQIARRVVPAGTEKVSARLVLRHDECLSRPVPSIGGSCGASTDAVAYSRVLDLAHLELRPYERVRAGCADPAGAAVEDDDPYAALRNLIRDGVLPSGDPPDGWLDAVRAVTSEVVAGTGPPGLVPEPSERERVHPVDEPGEIMLADLPEIELTRAGNGWRLAVPRIDLAVRRSHVPTWLLQELLAEALAGRAVRNPTPDAHGPRVSRVHLTGDRVIVDLTRDVVAGTVGPALAVRAFDAAAAEPVWGPPLDVDPQVTPRAAGTPPTPARITFTLPDAPTATLSYRMVLRGTGPAPLIAMVGRHPVPLAGRAGGPAAATEGCDVVETIEEGVGP